MKKQSRFYLGSSYYPPFHTPEEWLEDFRRMEEIGMNSLRTAELIASWEWIEPKKGDFDFSWLDRTFELCEKHGMELLLGTGAGSPPIWLRDLYPDVQIVDQHGVTYPTGAMWGWACIDHPGYRLESERYLNSLLDRYKDHPALLGWQIHNEIGHPASHGRSDGERIHYCYCEHTAKRFREWLQESYSRDIEALSEAWACTPTRHRYHDWVQIHPPRAWPSIWGSPGAWLDWREFIDRSFVDFVSWQNEIIKSKDPIHPTSTNLIVQDYGVARGVNPWLYGEYVDALGFDLYPIDRMNTDPWFASFQLDFARSWTIQAGKPLWLPEMESGPIGGWVRGPMHYTTAADIYRYNLEAIAHGGKMILYQGYREWDQLPLHWGALVDLDGKPTERYQAAGRINEMVQTNEALFLEAQPVPAEVGLIYDQANSIAVYGMDAIGLLDQGLKGIYSALWRDNIPIDFVTPQMLIENAGKRYKILFLPFMMLVSTELGRMLSTYVEEGGVLVGFAKSGMLDERGWYWHQRPGAGLAQVFGARETRIQPLRDASLILEGGQPLFQGLPKSLSGYWHRQDFEIADDAEILARYSDGEPAMIRRRHGNGWGYLFGTHLDVATLLYTESSYPLLWRNLLQIHEVQTPVLLEGDALIDAHLLSRGEEYIVVLVNHTPKPTAVRVGLPEVVPNPVVHDLTSGEPAQDISQAMCTITMDGGLGKVLLFRKE